MILLTKKNRDLYNVLNNLQLKINNILVAGNHQNKPKAKNKQTNNIKQTLYSRCLIKAEGHKVINYTEEFYFFEITLISLSKK